MDLDPLASRPISRRRLLQGTALAGFGAFLAACTGSSPTPSPTATPAAPTASASAGPTPTPEITPTPAITGPLMWANWPAYIDLVGAAANAGAYSPGSSPTIEAFKKQYKVDVKYVEDIQANEDFFKQKLETQFVAGKPTGWDLIVMTDWMAGKLIAKSWIQKIDQSAVPNCVQNLRDPLKNQTWDPGNDYHYPWQSGMTGVGYDSTALTKANIPAPTKIADLWNIDPKKVTFLTEKRDTFGLGLLKLGKDPTQATADDLQAVHDDMKPLADKGLRFTGNDYLQDFASRKTWAAMVWSGDLANSGAADQKFVFPEEGTMIWTDNMMIPKGATNVYTAELMMNWVYDPKIAAQIADYVKYVSPVKGADTEIEKIDKGASSNPLMFPTQDIIAKQKSFQYLTQDLEDTLNSLYSDLAGA
ncbi:MAG TPA: spermidine/putrescine ABC transporter substrate-binding protein [Candidatus Limnocylindrales bacterium]